MSSSFYGWYSGAKYGHWVNVKIYRFCFCFVLVLITCSEEERWFQDFLLLPQVYDGFPSDLPWARCRVWTWFTWRVWHVRCVCKWLSQCWLAFVLLWVGATLGNGSGIREQLHSFREVKCLQVYSKTLEWVWKPICQWWFAFVLLGVDATVGNWSRIWEQLHSFTEVKCLLSYSKILEWV